jgi:hypothetical protein
MFLFAGRGQVGAPAFMRGRSASALRKFGGNFVSRFSVGLRMPVAKATIFSQCFLAGLKSGSLC